MACETKSGLNPPKNVDEHNQQSAFSFQYKDKKMQTEIDSGYNYMCAEEALLNKDIKRAKYLLQLIDKSEDNALVAAKQLSLQALDSNKVDILKIAKRKALLYPYSAEIKLILGSIYMRNGEIDLAEEIFLEVIELDSSLELSYVQLISIYSVKKNFSKAKTYAKKMLANKPASFTALSVLVRIHIFLGDLNSAFNLTNKAYRSNPNRVEFAILYSLVALLAEKYSIVSRIHYSLFKKFFIDVKYRKKLIEIYKSFGRLEDLLERFERLTKKFPEVNNIGVELQSIYIAIAIGKDKYAIQNLEIITERNSELYEISYLLALLYSKNKKFDLALLSFKKIPPRSQYFLSANLEIIKIYRIQKRYSEAVSKYNSLLTLGESSWDLYMLAALSYKDIQDYPSAISVLDLAYKKYPNRIRFLFLRGVYKKKMERLKIV